MPAMTAPFHSADVAHAFDLKSMCFVEVSSSSKLYGLIVSYLVSDYADVISSAPSRRVADQPSGACDSDSDSDSEDSSLTDAKACVRPTTFTAGLGLFKLALGGSSELFALHQTVGEPVASECGPVMFTSIVLFAERANNGLEVLQSFCDKLISDSDQGRTGMFSVYRFNPRNLYWRVETRARARPMESVVLPEAVKDALIQDIDDFLSPATVRWYRAHGIPYRRSFLFHGTPGAGKTSLLQAIAGKYERNLCFLEPAHPDMTDAALKTAIMRVPKQSLVVLEDVESLFGKNREVKAAKSSLTFSGLLNALDGVGSSSGQLFILTTNFKQSLDEALIRPGRVDLHVAFGPATRELMTKLYRQFYPLAAEELALKFADVACGALGSVEVSMAALQHYFITCRRRTAEQAVEGAAEIAAELKRKAAEATKPEDAAKAACKAAGGGKGAKPKAAKKQGSAAVHVHIHTSAGAGEGGSGTSAGAGEGNDSEGEVSEDEE
jgi:chaperone BCS1